MTRPPAAAGLPDWRRAFGGPVIRAHWKSRPEDFRVTELCDVRPDGDGEHDWLWIEKRGVNTAWLARQLARIAGVAMRDVGYSGLKDRVAVARQWFSVRRPAAAGADWSALALPGVTLLEQARHGRKLRRGTHRGNAFEVTLRGVSGDAAERLADIARQGVPNYFGEQRFGRDAGNLERARALFAGRRLRREQRSLALSAARAYLFNVILDARVADASWNRLVAGDIASLNGSNSVFAVEAPDGDLERRAALLDLHPSGALWGRAGGGVGQRLLPAEVAATDDYADLTRGLERAATTGRRALRARIEDLRWTAHADTLRLEFTLGRGSYATALLREFAAYTAPAQDAWRSST